VAPDWRLGVYDLSMHNQVQPGRAQSRRELDNQSKGIANFGLAEPLQAAIDTNVAEVYANLDKA
jgi:hypothetical protein